MAMLVLLSFGAIFFLLVQSNRLPGFSEAGTDEQDVAMLESDVGLFGNV